MEASSPEDAEKGFDSDRSSYGSDGPQWKEVGGAYDAVLYASDLLSKLLVKISPQELPEVVYDVSSDGYARRVLPVLDDLVECTTWLRRIVLDECMAEAKIPRVDLAELSGISHATLSRWSKEAIQTDDEGSFGPVLRSLNSHGDSCDSHT